MSVLFGDDTPLEHSKITIIVETGNTKQTYTIEKATKVEMNPVYATPDHYTDALGTLHWTQPFLECYEFAFHPELVPGVPAIRHEIETPYLRETRVYPY